MKKNSFKYLIEFNKLLSANYEDSIPLKSFFNKADKGKFNTLIDYSFLKDFEKVINKIQSVLDNEHIFVKHVKELKNLAVANHIDSEGFKMTLKDTKLWRTNGKDIYPSLVYNNTYEDEHAIYENRIIKQLIDDVYKFLSNTLNEIADDLGNIRSYFKTRLELASSISIATRKNQKGTTPFNVLSNSTLLAEYYTLVEKLIKKTSNFKNSVLYKECAKKPPLNGPYYPTNILLKDANYRECYLFFKKLRELKTSNGDTGAYFYNNVLLKLFYALNKNEFTFAKRSVLIEKDENFYTCKDIEMQNSSFSIFITATKEGKIYILVKSLLNKEVKPLKIAIDVVEEISSSEKDYVLEFTKKAIKNGFDSSFVFTKWSQSLDEGGAISIGCNSNFESHALEDFISLITLTLNGSHFVYKKRCPICGSKYIESDNSVYSCYQCQGSWTLLKEDEQELIWIKNI